MCSYYETFPIMLAFERLETKNVAVIFLWILEKMANTLEMAERFSR